jgi:hypothetical protein
MCERSRVLALVFLTAAGGWLLGCAGSALSAQDASSDATYDGTTDGGGAEAGPDVKGRPCNSGNDCDPAHDVFCGFLTDGGCDASGVCISFFTGGCGCDAGGAVVCSCGGQLMAPSCCYPDGYQPVPLASPDTCVSEGGTDGGSDAGADAPIEASGD